MSSRIFSTRREWYAVVTFACARSVLGWIATGVCAAVALALLDALRAAPASSGGSGEMATSRMGQDVDVAALTALLSLIAILWLRVATLSLPACGPTG